MASPAGSWSTWPTALDARRKGGEWSTYGEPEGEFQQYGIGIHVLHPGQVNGLYHSESVQEDFLVLSGECLLLIEEEERQLKAWDFIHFAPGRGTSASAPATGLARS